MHPPSSHASVMALLAGALLLATPACGGESAAPSDGAAPPFSGNPGKADKADAIPQNFAPTIDAMSLFIDLGDLSGQATIWLDPTAATTVSLEAGGLTILDVFDDTGELPWEVRDSALHVRPAPGAPAFHIDYQFATQLSSMGYGPNGSTVIWPTFCGNLFPCRSDPADGMTFELHVVGTTGDDAWAIYPTELPADAPSYTLAFAVGAYTCELLGETDAGTGVEVCWLPLGKTKALKGTRHLTAAFDWLEKTLGPYSFGESVASVAVEWGDDGAGGMEHHPFWHVATSEMELPITHIHEAAHGWFGTGVRIACWEDFVLSEGTTTYLAARALGAVTDLKTEQAIWDGYAEDLLLALEEEDVIAWPETCGEVDLLDDGLFSNIVYMKGAFFWRDVAEQVGPEVLDGVLARFYQQRVGTAARFSELLEAVEADTGFDPSDFAEFWLKTRGSPWE
jgi:aminopeptidase N